MLQVIPSSPGHLQPVFAAMLEKAVRICDARFGGLCRWDGDALHQVATHNMPPAFAELAFAGIAGFAASSQSTECHRSYGGDQNPVHVADIKADPGPTLKKGIQRYVAAVELGGARTFLPPDAKGGELIGAVRLVAPGSPSLYRQADRVGYELRRPSCHRHREREAAERTASAHRRPQPAHYDSRGIGAADGNVGSAAGH